MTIEHKIKAILSRCWVCSLIMSLHLLAGKGLSVKVRVRNYLTLSLLSQVMKRLVKVITKFK